MMKELFFDAEIEILLFPESDIITTSGTYLDPKDPDELPGIIFP